MKFNHNIDFLLHWKVFLRSLCGIKNDNKLTWIWFRDSLAAPMNAFLRLIRYDNNYVSVETPREFDSFHSDDNPQMNTDMLPFYCLPSPNIESNNEDALLSDLRLLVHQQQAKVIVIAKSPWKSFKSISVLSQIVMECFEAKIPTIIIDSSPANDVSAFALSRVKPEHEPKLKEFVENVQRKRSVFIDVPNDHLHNAPPVDCVKDGNSTSLTVSTSGQYFSGKDTSNVPFPRKENKIT